MPGYTETEERKIIIALKAGDELAFRKVFDLHFHKLYAFCFRFLKNKQHAEEIVNDALLNVWTNRNRIDEERTILPYLYTITRRLALNALRDIATSQKAMDELWFNIERLSNETEELVLLNDLMQFTESAVIHLPAQQQLVFRMSRYEGLNYDEIAELLNLSRNTVKNHLVAALKTLRTRFNESDAAYFLLLSVVLLK
ncbi:RNA polymerase sigma-70 factor, ECF subfamily [Pedobacter sp. ok626]|uniref:RNA polymerase sigma factor n=1 Tax=Pedobacter sp. ok626 TaxID=1761882 RepID=UPI00088EA682|nr:RNA polymerase sigma-70 factor [Pedobacter sp. ok626]SDJ91344.1 RNA polymerase sigma-70 factor, ECF subfamily [Pedobacter sp. ok626]